MTGGSEASTLIDMSTSPTLLVLAAGMGSRYGGLKQVDGMGPTGEAILEYSIFDALRAGFGDILLVIRKDIEEPFREAIGRRLEAVAPIRYAFQELDSCIDWTDDVPTRAKPWGTAHAVLAAAPELNGPFAVVNADDFYGAGGYRGVVEFLDSGAQESLHAHCLPGYRLGNTLSDNGTVSRGVCEVDERGRLTRIVERKEIGWKDGKLVDAADGDVEVSPDAAVSMNFWGLQPSVLDEIRPRFQAFVEANRNNPKAELYLPVLMGDLVTEGKATVDVLTMDEPWFGVTYPEDKASVQASLQAVVESGAYPSPLWG
jgi:NDP-sugar pyrophosphorylase family protein